MGRGDKYASNTKKEIYLTTKESEKEEREGRAVGGKEGTGGTCSRGEAHVRVAPDRGTSFESYFIVDRIVA